jgi:hypothetical protein
VEIGLGVGKWTGTHNKRGLEFNSDWGFNETGRKFGRFCGFFYLLQQKKYLVHNSVTPGDGYFPYSSPGVQ